MYYNKNAQSPFDGIFAKEAQSNGLRYDFLRNIAQIESSYNPSAKAKGSTATGIMQLTKAAGHDVGLVNDEDFLNPEANIRGGAKYLSNTLKASNGDEIRAALAYHSGLGSDDIKNYDKGDYASISPAGRQYIERVKGNAEGGEHAEPHFEEHGTPWVPYDYQLHNKQEVSKDLNIDLPNYTPALTSDPDTKDAIPDPNGDNSFNTLYQQQNNGLTPSQAEDLSTFHGMGQAASTALEGSTLGTAYENARSSGIRGALDSLIPNNMNAPLTEEQIKKIDAANLPPSYIHSLGSYGPDTIDAAIKSAQERVKRDEELQSKHVGAMAQMGGGLVGMFGDPTTYAMFMAPMSAPEVLSAKFGAGAFSKFAISTATRGVQDAAWGAASEYVRSNVSGGDSDLTNAALGGFILGGAAHGLGALGKRVFKRSTVEEGLPMPEPLEAHTEAPTQPESLDSNYAHARRNELSEGARTTGTADPTVKQLTGEERVHFADDGNPYTVVDDVTDPNVETHPLDNGPAPDVITASGQRMDGANPFNPATRKAVDHIEQEFNEADNITSDKPIYRAAKGVGARVFGSLADIGHVVNSASMDSVRRLGNLLMESTTGLVDESGAKKRWFGNLPGQHTGSEIHAALHALDNTSMHAIDEATKDLHKGARYAHLGEEEARQEMWRRLVEAVEDKSGNKMSQLDPKEQKAALALRKHYVDKADQLLNPQRWGNDDANPIITDTIDPNHYTSIVYDRGLVNDMVEQECGGDKENAVQLVKESFMRSYHSDPEVKARVDNAIQQEHMSSSEVSKRKTEIKHEQDKYDKKKAKADEAEQKMAALGTKQSHTQGYVDQFLADAKLTDAELPQLINDAVQKRLSRFKKAPSQAKLATIIQEETDKVKAAQKRVIDRAKKNANVDWQNVRRRADNFKAQADAQFLVVDDLKAKLAQPLTQKQLIARAGKMANDTAYGIIHAGEGENATDIAAIERAIQSNDLAGVGNSGFLKTRSLFGYNGEVQLPSGGIFTVNYLRNFNMDDILPLYNRQMNGHISIVGSTGQTVKSLAASINEIKASIKLPKGVRLEGAELATLKAKEREVEALEESVKLLMGRKRSDTPTAIHAVSSILTDMAFLTHNMWFFVNNGGEIAALITKKTQQMAANAFPALGNLVNKGSKMTPEDLKFMHNSLFGHELMASITPKRKSFVNALIEGHTNPLLASGLGSIQYGVKRAVNWSPFTRLLHISTQKIIECAEKDVITSVAMDALEAGEKSVYMDSRYLNSAGLSQEQAAKVYQLFKDHCYVKDGKLKVKDMDAFRHDSRSSLLVRLARRASSEAIQKENIAQSTVKPASWWMSLAMQFKRFVMKAMNSKFARSYHEAFGNNRKADMALYTLLGTGLSTAVYGMQAIVTGETMPESKRREYWDYKFDPKMLAYAAITRNSIIGAPLGVASSIAGAAGYDPAMSVRSSILQPMGNPRKQPSFMDNPDKIEAALGGNLLKNMPGVAIAANGIAGLVNGYKIYNYKDLAARDHAVKGAYNALRNVTPIDPATQALLRHFVESSGYSKVIE